VETSREQQLDDQLILREFLRNTKEGVRIVDTKGFIIFVNRAYCKLTGYSRDELLKMNIRDIDFPDYPEEVDRRIEAVMKKGAEFSEMRQRRKDGSFFDTEVSSTFLNASGGIIVSVCRDITITKENQAERSLIVGLLLLGNQPANKRLFMADAVELLQKWSGCEAAGIRFKDGDDYPYHETAGFPPGFVETANNFCTRDEAGLPVKCVKDIPALECMCANVIHGHTDPATPFFTPSGSFWTNSVTALLAGVTEEQLRPLARGHCLAQGYESLALIPLKWGAVNLGLIHLSDRRQGRFSPSAIVALEYAAIILAAGLVSRRATEELLQSEERYRMIVDTALEGIVVMDRDHRVTFANKAMTDMLGIEAQHAIGSRIEDAFYTPADDDISDEYLRRRLEGRNEIYERCYRHKNGSPVWAMVSARALLDKEGNFDGAFAMVTDITARKKMEEGLRRSEEKYRLIVEASLEGILVADHEFRLTYVNNALAKMLGYSPDELVGNDVQDFFYDPPGPEGDVYLQRRRDGRDEIHERRFRHKDGHSVWTIVSAKSLQDKADSFAGSFAMITDISRTKILEEELRQSVEQYRTLVEAIPDVLTRFDSQLRFIGASNNIVRETGIPLTSLIGKTHHEAGFPEKLSIFAQETINKVFTTGRPLETEFIFDGPQGKKLFNWRVIPELDAQGEVTSVVTLGRDITQYRQTQREYQTLFREMFDGFAVHEIILDDEGKPVDYRFLAVNPAFERLTGLKAEDVVGRRILEILPDTEPHWIEAYGRVALTGKPAFFEMHHNGLGKDFQISAYRPAPLQCANIFIDITGIKQAAREKERMQAQLFQAQKMESVGLLAGGVAHDFNNKLGVILGNAEMALEAIDQTHPARGRIQEIIKASSLSADLTRQLLTFARKQAISPRLLDLNDALGNIFKMLHRLIGEDIELIHEAGENLWPVEIDPAQVDQIMANLCINARDAIHGRGRITLTTSNVSLDAAYCRNFDGLKPGDYVRLTVADTGSGMSEEVKKHLFDPFFTTKEEGKGTGLGLATVYGAVKQNRGYIYAESELGKGTVFTIYLPRQTGGVDTEAVPQGGKAAGGKETILVVEDEHSILNVLYLLLGHLGYHVLAAASPAEAMIMAGRHRQKIDLLITDVAMPGMSGFELAHAMKDSHPHLKVMFISGHTPDGVARYGELDEDAVFIQKPFTQEVLAAKVREALKKNNG
jgi:PAS domain S-box-containing protein